MHWLILLGVVALSVASSSRAQRDAARARLAKWNWLFASFTIVTWACLLFWPKR